MSTSIESLEIEIKSSSTSASDGLERLADSLGRIRDATKGGLGLTSVANQLERVGKSLSTIDGSKISNLKGISDAIKTLSGVKVSASIGNQITNINTALQGLNIGDGAGKITDLVSALKPLETLGKSSLGTTVNALKKLPDALNKIDMRKLHGQVDALTRTFRPLAEEMQKIANGFNAFPSRIQRIIQENERLSVSNNKTSTSYVNLWAKMRMAYNTLKTGARLIGSAISKMNDYIEDVNLFNASMGSYAKEAGEYAERVGEIMGIDPGEWMRNQGVFMTLATGFGVVSDRAYIMSKNLTQLGYDLSSFFNISYEDAMLKLQSGLAGELEPLRRIGYDLSVARLQQEAYTLGINKKVSAMTQAEKAELRYHAILTQVTVAQGDMARTLNAPANQLRIFKSQVEQAARAIGSIFIPILNKVLPYLIAVAKVVRLVASVIAGLFGFEMPEVDYSGVEALGGGAEDASTALGNAADNAKKLKQYTMGFDELNVINPDSGSGGAGGGSGVGGGGGFDFELPEYDFLKDLSDSKVAKIVEDMKEWLGLTEEIDSWAEFFDTNLGQILITVGLIGLGIAAWKITTNLITGIGNLKSALSLLGKSGAKAGTITLGATLAITGIALEGKAVIDAFRNGLDALNFSEMIGGSGLVVTGGAIIGKALGSTVIGASIGAIVAGIPMFVTGVYDAIKNGLDWLNGILIPLGSTMAGAGIGAIIGSLGGPIGAGVGALIGLVVGALTDIGIWAAQNWDSITDFFTKTVPTWFSKINWSAVGEFIGQHLFDCLLFLGNPFLIISNWIMEIFDFEINWKTVGEAIGKGFAKAVKFLGDAWSFCNEWLSPSSLLKKLVKAISEVDWKKVTETAKTYAKKAFDIAGDILSGIVKGFKDGWNDFWSDVKDFIDGFVDAFKEELGIHSPSTVFEGIAKDIISGLIQGITNFFTTTKESIVKWANGVKEWFTKGDDGKTIFDKFTGFAKDIISDFGSGISTTYTTTKDKLTTWASSVKDWFTKDDGKTTIFDKFKGFATDVVDKFSSGISTNYNLVKEPLTTWASSVKEWFTKEDGDTETIFDKFTNYGGTLVSNLSGAIDGGVSEQSYETIFGRIKSALDSITTPIRTTANSIIGIIESLTNKVIDGINGMINGLNKISFTVPKWVPGLGGNSFGLGIPTVNKISIPRIPTYADGGFVPNGEAFVAREAGPELVGTIGRRTAVANNDQIVAGIASGVAEANNESNALLKEQNSLLRAMLEKESGVYLDGKTITKSVEKHQRERGRVLVTGGAY